MSNKEISEATTTENAESNTEVSTKDHEIVILDDGRKVKVVELTGFDEMIAAKVIGNEMNTPGAGMLQYRMILLAFSVKEIDGRTIDRPKNIDEVRHFLAQFKMKQSQMLQRAFSRLNDAGEAQAAE